MQLAQMPSANSKVKCWNATRNKKGGENLAVVTSRGGVLLGKSANKISK